jgi:SAM-dependent methyltransferase
VIHRAAATGFARAACEYERGRPGYPAAVIDALGAGPGLVVLDLAAGTGALTRALLDAGVEEVIAVEPVAEMRAALPAGARALEGTAEAIPLAESSVDLATVAQAFHWFDGERALAEIHRVLRPGGRLALVWNRRVEEDPVNRALDAILERHRAGTPTHRHDAWRAAFERTTLFGPLEEHEFPNEQTLDADGLADRVGSISFVASLPEAERSEVLDAARALAAGGPVTVPYRTQVQICQRRAHRDQHDAET